MGASLALVGICSAVAGAVLVNPMVRSMGDRYAMLAGIGFGTLGFFLLGWANTGWLCLLATPLVSLWGIGEPAAQGLMTRYVSASEQGQLQGALNGLRGAHSFLVFAKAIDTRAGWQMPGAPFYLDALFGRGGVSRGAVCSASGTAERNFWRSLLLITVNGRFLLLALTLSTAAAQIPPKPLWKFAVSGDSRNCGDIVMPAIASAVHKSGAAFYWHLGDFRAIYDFDEDMAPPAKLQLNAPHLTISDYLNTAWPTFIHQQLEPFSPIEVFLAMGNHETIYPKTRDDVLVFFERYLNAPRLQAQRNADRDTATRTYYHWVMNGSVDFITLDNSVDSTFDAQQLRWIKSRLDADGGSSSIRTIVVGMHEALPGSKGLSHSMCDSKQGVASGRNVYEQLWNLEQRGKKVYVLASHSHFVMDDVFHTPYWGARVLPGWIVGTAGAVRYRLPPGVAVGTIARTDVYGYLLATVMSDASIEFSFQEETLDDLRLANAGKNPDSLVHWCFNENADQTIPAAGTCKAE